MLNRDVLNRDVLNRDVLKQERQMKFPRLL
jgi:hypothetical protein